MFMTMPRKSAKQEIFDLIVNNTLQDLLDSDSDEDLWDEIMCTLEEDLAAVESLRRGYNEVVPKSSHWRVTVLCLFDDDRFKHFMRCTRDGFNTILILIKNDPVFQKQAHQQLPIELQLQIVLFRLGSSGEGASVRKVASLFGIGDGGTISKITYRVFKAILNLKSRFVYWPSVEERKELIEKTKHELPGCIGYVDGTELKLVEAPVNNHELYFSRKRHYALKAQVVCDHKLRILQFSVGFPGSFHDAKMFALCKLSQDPDSFFSSGEYMAGDSAYTLKPYLITPYRRNSRQHTANMRHNFNTTHSSFRVRVEHCFALLKEIFSSLKELRFRIEGRRSIKFCNDWFAVCCILHNIRICHHGLSDEDINVLPISTEDQGSDGEILRETVDINESTDLRSRLTFLFQ